MDVKFFDIMEFVFGVLMSIVAVVLYGIVVPSLYWYPVIIYLQFTSNSYLLQLINAHGCFMLLSGVNIAFMVKSERYFNFVRKLLWLWRIQVPRITIHVFYLFPCFYEVPLYYANCDANKYENLTEFCAELKSRARNKLLKKVPSYINNLKKEHNYMCKTSSCEYLSFDAISVCWEHTAMVSRKYNYFYRIGLQCVMCIAFTLSYGTIDKFYVDNELVGVYWTFMVGNGEKNNSDAIISLGNFCTQKGRQHQIFFEGCRMYLKRAIAIQEIKYVNLLSPADPIQSKRKEFLNLRQTRKELGFKEFWVSKKHEPKDVNFYVETMGIDHTKSWLLTFPFTMRVAEIPKEFYNVYDQSDDFQRSKNKIVSRSPKKKRRRLNKDKIVIENLTLIDIV
eukprot:378716_1